MFAIPHPIVTHACRPAAQATADETAAVAQESADRDALDADHDVTYTAAAAPLYQNDWINTTAGQLTFDDAVAAARAGRTASYVAGDGAYDVAAAQAAKQHALDVATAEKSYQLALLAGDPDAETNHQAALAAADHDRAVAEADAKITWTGSVTADDATFAADYGSQNTTLVTTLAGLANSRCLPWPVR